VHRKEKVRTLGKNLTTGIKGITDKLKENEKAVGDNKRNVGNYEEAVTNALGKVSIFGVNLGGVTRNIQAGIAKGQGLVKTTLAQAKAASVSATATTAQGTATAGASVASGGLTAALKIVKIALISTGIGAIVVLLGSLVGAFASTQRGSDAFSKVLTPLKFIIQGILGVLQDLSFILVDKVMATFNEFKSANIGDIFKKIGDAIVTNVLNRINSIGIAGKAIVKILSGDFKEGFKELGMLEYKLLTGITDGTDKLGKGVELAKDGFDILKDKIKQSADEGTRYKEMTIAMELAQIRLATAIAISNRDMKEAMLISSDVTKTDEERIVALEKAIKLSNTKAAQEKELVSAELALAQLKTQQNDTDRVALLEIANLKAKLIDLDAEAFAEQRRINTQLSAFKAEIIKNEEDRIEALKEIIGLEDEKLQKNINLR